LGAEIPHTTTIFYTLIISLSSRAKQKSYKDFKIVQMRKEVNFK